MQEITNSVIKKIYRKKALNLITDLEQSYFSHQLLPVYK